MSYVSFSADIGRVLKRPFLEALWGTKFLIRQKIVVYSQRRKVAEAFHERQGIPGVCVRRKVTAEKAQSNSGLS